MLTSYFMTLLMGPEALCFRVVRLSVRACVRRQSGCILRPACSQLAVSEASEHACWRSSAGTDTLLTTTTTMTGGRIEAAIA